MKEVIENEIGKIALLCDSVRTQLNKTSSMVVSVADDFEYTSSFVDIIKSSAEWPEAISEHAIVDTTSDADKFLRADGILAVVVGRPIDNLGFLDFGCGEGHVVKKAAEQGAKVAVGYDIEKLWRDEWDGMHDNCLMTSDWQKVIDNGLYDVVLCYDVLDHVVNENQVSVLKKMSSMLKPNGRIYLRCHPWTSRHATHIYRSLNKAYVHMFLNDAELQSLGLTPFTTVKLIHPQNQYKSWFGEVGLDVKNTNLVTEEVESFFQSGIFATTIKSHWMASTDESLSSQRVFPLYQLETQFVDYILCSK